MDAIEFMRWEAKKTYAWLELNVSDVTQQQAVWRPPGTANSIAASYAHTVIAADFDLNHIFHGHETLLARAWSERLGLSESFPDDWPADVHIDWATLHAYGRAVSACVERLFDELTDADLEREFEMRAYAPEKPGQPREFKSLGTWRGLGIYTLHGIGHVVMHGGEIACLKGLQGGRGYLDFSFPYPE